MLKMMKDAQKSFKANFKLLRLYKLKYKVPTLLGLKKVKILNL